ncbi:hypothetical protein Bbelb_167380 [Branchiostoma belcheri]|nr:hypothetical protein Bbelb_167380 [Branchiostoma belcheri]
MPSLLRITAVAVLAADGNLKTAYKKATTTGRAGGTSYVIGGIGVFGQVVPSGALIASPAQCNRPSRANQSLVKYTPGNLCEATRAGQSSYGPDHDQTGYQARKSSCSPEENTPQPLIGWKPV